MRYIQEESSVEKPEKKEIPQKAGTKDYDYSNLANVKKIPTKGGYQ